MAKTKRTRSEDRNEAESGSDRDVPKNKKAKNNSAKESLESSGMNEKGEKYWELANSKRRATVTSFKNEIYVDFREFYEKDGERLPGKKGIFLSVEQYNALLMAIPAINNELIKRGTEVGQAEAESAQDDIPAPTKRVKAKPLKSNIEATSDEEE